MKTWLTHLGVAVLAFGTGALAWDWWSWPTQNDYVCERLEGDGLFHTTYAYVPSEHAVYESWYTNRTPLFSYGRHLFDEYTISKPQEDELYRATTVRTVDNTPEGYQIFTQYIVRRGSGGFGVEMEQRTWNNYSDARTYESATPRVRQCIGRTERLYGGMFS